MFWWVTLIIAGIILLLHGGTRNAVWGTATIGLLVGIIITVVHSDFDWWIIGKAASIGTFVGAILQWVPVRGLLNKCGGSLSSVDIACNTFDVANSTIDATLHAINPYTTRANNRYAILRVQPTGLKEYTTKDANAYDKAVAACTDLSDLDPYTATSLDAHTSAMDSLTSALDNLTESLVAIKGEMDKDLYAAAVAVYESYCTLYKLAAEAYSKAANCAALDASSGKLQSIKNKFNIMILDAKASNAPVAAAIAAKDKVDTFKTKASDDANGITLLEQQVAIAKNKAKQFLSKWVIAARSTMTDLDHHNEMDL